ncbi:MAG: hypothetical protein ACK4GL_01300 [Flavobacteriales bacterium]
MSYIFFRRLGAIGLILYFIFYAFGWLSGGFKQDTHKANTSFQLHSSHAILSSAKADDFYTLQCYWFIISEVNQTSYKKHQKKQLENQQHQSDFDFVKKALCDISLANLSFFQLTLLKKKAIRPLFLLFHTWKRHLVLSFLAF